MAARRRPKPGQMALLPTHRDVSQPDAGASWGERPPMIRLVNAGQYVATVMWGFGGWRVIGHDSPIYDNYAEATLGAVVMREARDDYWKGVSTWNDR